MKLSIIAALDENKGIGKDGKLPPWNAPGDLKRFKELTDKKIVVMGRNTFQSIRDITPPEKEVLPGRIKIVVSTTMEPDKNKILVVDSLAFAMHFAKNMVIKFNIPQEIMIIGGAQLYEEALPLSSKMYLTLIKGTYDCDVRFPEFSKTLWTESSKEDIGDTHSFVTFDKTEATENDNSSSPQQI
jgi:dihydrofolate reductase